MRPHLLSAFLAGLLMLNPFASATEKESTGVPERRAAGAAQPFKELAEKIWAAWETLDPAKAAGFYAKEADRVFYDVTPLKYTGWEEYAEGVRKAFGDYASFKGTLGDDFRATQRGSFAWGTATWHAELMKKDGSKEALSGRWTVLWEKRGKNWLIIHEHVSVPAPTPTETARLPLYKRLGGYDSIAAVVDDFIPRLATDRQLSRFFTGVSTESKRRIRQLVVDQLCAATGGPCFYTGRSMKASHEGLGITETDWQLAVNHLVATLDAFRVPQRERNEVLAAVSSLKGEIVAPPRR
jgi:hemoglobin